MFTKFQQLPILLLLVSIAIPAFAEDADESEPFKPDAEFWIDAAGEDLEQGLYDEACRAATEAIRLKATTGYVMRAMARIKKNDLRRALDDCNKSIDVEEDKEILASAFALRAGIHLKSDHFQEAIADSSKALELDQSNEGALITRVAAFVELDRFDSAIADCDRLVRLDPKDATNYRFRSACWLKLNEWDKAVADATKAVDLEPEDGYGYSLRGQAYAIHKQYRLAVADLKHAAELCKDDDAMFTVFVCMLVSCPEKKFNDYEGAIELVRGRCKTTEWKECLWISMLASIYAEAGDFPRAVEYGKKAVDLTTGEDRELAEHNLQLFNDGKTLHLAEENFWTDSEPLRR